jgi:hypothetical protein
LLELISVSDALLNILFFFSFNNQNSNKKQRRQKKKKYRLDQIKRREKFYIKTNEKLFFKFDHFIEMFLTPKIFAFDVYQSATWSGKFSISLKKSIN